MDKPVNDKTTESLDEHCGGKSELIGLVISPDVNTWIKKADGLPEGNQRVLTHSPCYEGKDATMEYRMMSGGFVRIATDVESWMIPRCKH